MHAEFCTSQSELRRPCVENRNCTTKSCFLTSRPFVRVGRFSRKDKSKVSKHDARRMAVSCQLMPRHLEESVIGRKRLEEPNRKLDYVRTLLIDNYDSYTYNIYQELSVVNGVPPVVVRNDEWTWEDVRRYVYEEKAFDNIIISPGPGSPTCPSDIGICSQLLLECTDIPILGVCLGHQALGYVHGAQVVHANEPVHGRLSDIEHSGCKLFQNIPSGRNSGFKVVRYHSLVIDEETLPEELIPIAWTSSSSLRSFHETEESGVVPEDFMSHIGKEDSYDSASSRYQNGSSWSSIHFDNLHRRVLMGVMHSTRPHYGVQFHPESVATCYGRQIFKNFREITEDYWLRLRSSSVGKEIFPYSACMQLPHLNRQSRACGGSKLVNGVYGQLLSAAHKNEQRVYVDEKSPLGRVNAVNFPIPNTGVKLLKLRWRKLGPLAAQVGGSGVIFSELFGAHKAENTFWLDSSSTEKNRARFSFMGGKGGSLWKQLTFRLADHSDEEHKHGGYLSVEDVQGKTARTYLKEGFLQYLNKELLSLYHDEEDFKGLPFEFYGGYVGYIGYNLKVECGATSNRHSSRTPDACFFFVDNLVVIDHWSDDIYILTLNEEHATTGTWLDDTEKKLLNLRSFDSRKLTKATAQSASSNQSKAGFLAEKSQQEYVEDVEKCLRYIKDGESYELCLTTQMRKRIGKLDPIDLYFHLRNKNPAPYAAWLNFPRERLSICSSSPERFLRLDTNGMLEAKPIKGTIARGSTKEEDEQLKLKLQYSEKDQAENLMIVDLLRNDLGRVCEPGSVHVPRLMDIESYATVHTMVSTICGKKQPNVSAVDCVKAAFPGGSMTGAPKLRSMELLDSIESCSRGIYSGSIGFFSYNQTFDLNIVIRTIVIHEDEASIGAGGAIVALSNPKDEYDEMILKTRAPVKAIMEFQEHLVPIVLHSNLYRELRKEKMS